MNYNKLIVFLILAIVITVSFGTVLYISSYAKTEVFSEKTDAAETQFRGAVKEILKSAGAKNAGITMTKTCDSNSFVDYSVVISLPEYISLNTFEKGKLLDSLYGLNIDVKDASVSFSFS